MKKILEETPARRAYLDLVQVTDRLTAEFGVLFADHGLTATQFNVLRILIQGPKEGLPSQQIGERLLTRVPDVTRIVDRMESAGLIERERSASDRRVVLVRATREGRKRCEALYGPVAKLHEQQLASLPSSTLQGLLRGLQKLRE